MRVRDDLVDDVSGHTYVHKYSDFLVWVGLASARPDKVIHTKYTLSREKKDIMFGAFGSILGRNFYMSMQNGSKLEV